MNFALHLSQKGKPVHLSFTTLLTIVATCRSEIINSFSMFLICCRAPCLLLIDDIDMLCFSREKSGNTGVVTALLHLMDGLGTTSSEGNIKFHYSITYILV